LRYYIIRRVVAELQREFPGQLATFVTLSPVPGFRRWLESRLRQPSPLSVEGGGGGGERELLQLFPEASNLTEALQLALAQRDWAVDGNGALANALRSPLLSLCARYLVREKRRSKALDPVAHFHLSGGSSVWRLNWLADTSPLGLQNSYGVMCNYHYRLPRLNVNSDWYRATGKVAVSDGVRDLLEQLD
jgi:malonyl-CoA decarboxylase